MKNNIKPITPTAHAMTQNSGVNPKSRFGKLMAEANKWSEAEDKLDGDIADFSRGVDDLNARLDAVKKRFK